MNYGSVCSGIEAATVAWEPLGWKASFYSEIESFPSDLLRTRFPSVPNLGDMTKYKEWPNANIDVLVGGTPCQAFSVAGLREGLSDPRGNLMLTYVAIARKYRPPWVVWENVPGVLSSDDGRDFASLLAVLTGRAIVAPSDGWKNCGIVPGIESAYGLAWRVLDAQYFGVAQIRRRVFVVGHLGNWRRAAAVLLELSSLRGDPAPQRRARKNVAAGVGGSAAQGGGAGAGTADADIAGSLTTRTRGGTSDDLSDGHLIRNEVVAATLDTEGPASGQRAGSEGALVFAEGTGRGTPLVVGTLTGDGSKNGRPDIDAGRIIAVNGAGSGDSADVSPTLTDHLNTISDTTPVVFQPRFARNGRGAPSDVVPPLLARAGESGKGDAAPVVAQPFHTIMENYGAFTGDNNETRLIGVVPIDMRQGSRGATMTNNRREGSSGGAPGTGVGNEGDPAPTVSTSHTPAVAVGFSCKDSGNDAGDEVAPTLRAMGTDESHANGGGQAAVAFDARQSDVLQHGEKTGPLDTDGQSTGILQPSMRVRRLTPLECERLQGFPDLHTLIDRDGEPAKDGPRYKAIGNSMAVPVMRWIGQRIDAVEAVIAGEAPPEAIIAAPVPVENAPDTVVVRTHNLHDEAKGDVWLSDIPGALNATGSTPNQFDAVAYEAATLERAPAFAKNEPANATEVVHRIERDLGLAPDDFLCMDIGKPGVEKCPTQCANCEDVESEFQREHGHDEDERYVQASPPVAVGYDSLNVELTGDVSAPVTAAAGTTGNRQPQVLVEAPPAQEPDEIARPAPSDDEGVTRRESASTVPPAAGGAPAQNATTREPATSEATGSKVEVATPPVVVASPGRCAKTHVECLIITADKSRTIMGSNECANPQPKCPREPGEGYEKCKSICQQRGHAEAVALEKAREAGLDLNGAVAVLMGHYYACEPCARGLRDAGFARIQVVMP